MDKMLIQYLICATNPRSSLCHTWLRLKKKV